MGSGTPPEVPGEVTGVPCVTPDCHLLGSSAFLRFWSLRDRRSPSLLCAELSWLVPGRYLADSLFARAKKCVSGLPDKVACSALGAGYKTAVGDRPGISLLRDLMEG